MGECSPTKLNFMEDLKKKGTKAFSIEEFKSLSQPEIWNSIAIKGGNFMDCHKKIFAETGVWIEELVPVFQKLDALAAKRG